jgi:hypothetical protein
MTHVRRTIPVVNSGAAAMNCPLTPPEQATVYAKALHRACLILGGIEQLATHLQVPKELLERWIRGEGEPTHEVFLAAVEIILLYAAQAGRPI